MELSKSTVNWSKDKLAWMEEQLKSANHGYWWRDTWKPEENPLKPTTAPERKSRKLALHFEKIQSISLRTEMKFACYQRFLKGEWSYGYLHGETAVAVNKYLSNFFDQHANLESLLEKSFSEWEILLRTFLVKNNLYRSRKRQYVFLKTGEIKESERDDRRIYTLRRIYEAIESAYDNREEWEKDIWRFSNLGIIPCPTGAKKLNFTKIYQPWLKKAVKQFCQYNLVTKNLAPQSCAGVITAIKFFSRYLAKYHPSITESQLERPLFESFLAYLFQEYPNDNTRLRTIGTLNTFFTSNELHKWLDISQRLVFPSDMPKENRNPVESRVIPDVVMEQLLQHVSELPDYQRRMFIILANTGMRIGELLELSFDCLKSNGSGGYLLTYYQSKVKTTITKPIASIFHSSDEIIAAIREQQDYVRQKFGAQCPYLFPSPRSKPGQFKPFVGASNIRRNLKRIACTHKIVDENGKFWNLHPHQFRHTVGTKLANDDEVGLFGTKTYLGHASIRMTEHYARMEERILQKKIEAFNANNQIIDHTGKAVNLSQDERFKKYWEYIKKGDLLKSQMMEHGICTLPATLSPCPHKHKCLSCTHFVTTPDHLPIHENEYKVQLARKQAAEARGQKRVIEDYDNTLKQLEAIIAKCGGDVETIEARVESNETAPSLYSAQIQQLMAKMGIATFDELKQIIASVEEASDG